ncbi:hypothetical protein BH11CYA1_BH11CYA1_00290 [soil metagenome]
MAPSRTLRKIFFTSTTQFKFAFCLTLINICTQPMMIAAALAQSSVQLLAQKAPALVRSKSIAGSEQIPASNTKLVGTINAFGMACVSTGVIPLSTQLPTTVEEVKKGSRAFYAGVLVGDRILQATIEKDVLKLQIERNGHVYLASMQAQMDSSRPLRADATRNLTSVLRSYQIRLIVDRSGSMYRPLGNSDKLRWTWVKEELDRFCSRVQIQTNSSFDLYLFNDEVDAAASQSSQQIRTKLANTVTTGGTNLPAALRLATANSPKPILVILVTDGQAVSSKENGAILAENLSKTAVLRRSRVVFLQAGYSPEGSSFIASLNDALVVRGMGKQAYAVLFEDASQRGILGAIEPLLMQ